MHESQEYGSTTENEHESNTKRTLIPVVKMVSFLLKRLSDLSALRLASLRVLELLPANRMHRVALFASSHEHTELIASCTEVIVGLVAKTDL